MKSIVLRISILFLPMLALHGCQTPPVPAELPCGCNTQSHLIAATLFTQHASEYKALCMQAYNAAQSQLPGLIHEVQKPAVVLDLDETVLDNSPYTAWQIKNDLPYSPDTWTEWVERAKAKAVPGVEHFLRFADSLGVALFYISNRDTSHLEATMENMRALGLPQVVYEHFMLKTNTSDKTERRNAVEAMGYSIVMLVGDNLGDFRGEYDKPATNPKRDEATLSDRSHFGKRYIMLPNTLYGTWEGAMYGYNRDLSDTERCAIRLGLLEE